MNLLEAHVCEDLFSPEKFRQEYKELARTHHPDCGGSVTAFQKLNELYEEAEWKANNNAWGIPRPKAHSFIDDQGKVWKQGNLLFFLNASVQDYTKTTGFEHYKRYWAPLSSTKLCLNDSVLDAQQAEILSGDVLLQGTKWRKKYPNGLPQEHAAWIGSRLYEFAMYLEANGLVHCGLIPSSVFIGPKEHGIRVISSYHLVNIGANLKTISAQYKHWYPSSIFGTKVATTSIDLELIRNLLLYIVDANSLNPEYRKWLNVPRTNAKDTFQSYRKMLQEVFGPPKYYELIL